MNAESTHIKGSVEHTLRDQEVLFLRPLLGSAHLPELVIIGSVILK